MRGPNLADQAWRNLWRNRRRTILTLVAIAFGMLMSILVTAMMDKSFTDFIDTAAKLGGGHVTLENPAYQDAPTFANGLPNVAALEKTALSDERVSKVAARVSGQAMLSTARESFGVVFMAYDPAKESKDTLSLLEGKVTGHLLEHNGGQGLVLGSKLTKTLDVSLGDKLVYTLTNAQGQIVTGLGRLVGILHTGTPSLDAGLCLMPLATAQKILGYGPDEATLIAVFLRDARESHAVARSLGKEVGPKVSALPWDEVRPGLRAFISAKVGGARFMEILVMLLVAAGIFNTLFVAVTERMREFGILVAIGHSPFQIFRLVVWESLWLGLVGLVAGGAVTAWPYWYLHTHGIDLTKMMQGGMDIGGVGFSPVLHIAIFPEHLVMILVLVLAATVAAGLYPAWRAGRVHPVDAIKLV